MNEEKRWDVAIIGCGIAGIYAAYELIKKNPDIAVIIFESGEDIHSRSCPIVAKKTKECVGCSTCAIMKGFGGAGAYSDGKYNFTTEFGGWLSEYMHPDEIMELINYVDFGQCPLRGYLGGLFDGQRGGKEPGEAGARK